MKEYHKIQSVFKRDEKTHKFIDEQYSMEEFSYLANNDWVMTEKIDGTNVRIMWDGENVTFGGRTDNAQMPVFLLYKLQEIFEGTEKKKLLKEVFTDKKTGEFMNNVCLYGEGYGAKIQKGGGNYIPDGVDFILFDVLVGDWWLKREDVEEIASKLNLKVVPIIKIGTIGDAIWDIKQGIKSTFGDFLAEGLVLKPRIELKTRSGHRIITKLKHKDF